MADLASRSALEAGPRLQEVLERIKERTSLVEEIRTELDRLPAAAEPASSSLPPTTASEPAAPPDRGAAPSPAPSPPPGDERPGTTGTGSAF